MKDADGSPPAPAPAANNAQRSGVRPRAFVDLADIWIFIAEDSVKQADRFAALIDSQFRTLARQPQMGRSRPELATDLRSFPVGRYVTFYVPLPHGVEIVRVLHGARDLESVLREDE